MDDTKSHELSRNVEWEIAHLKAFDPVRSDTVTYELDEAGWAYISFEIETDVLLEPEDTPVRDVEPIIFRYPSENEVGRRAPAVFSGRADFPRDLPHINPSASTEPAWLCLARSGLQQIYDADGIAGVVVRLMHWLNDAKTGAEFEDGWEPVPGLEFEACVVGRMKAAELQEWANAEPGGGGAYLSAKLVHRESGDHTVYMDDTPIDLANAQSVQAARQSMAQYNPGGQIQTAVPAIFVWPNTERVETIPHFNTWRDMASLREGLQKTGVEEEVGRLFQLIDVHFRLGADGRPPELDHFGTPSKKVLILIVGLWRPVPIDETIVGLSGDPEARKLELRVFYLERPAAEDRWSTATRVRDFFGLIPLSTELLQAVSGEPPLPKPVIFGAGALGSVIADHALRGGSSHITVVDKDRLLPHNIARHLGCAVEIQNYKTEIVRRQAHVLGAGSAVTSHTDDIAALSDEELLGVCEDASLLIDATANPLVRSRLSRWQGKDVPMLRSEVFHKGRLGVHLTTRSGSQQSFNCLYYQAVLYAVGSRWIREWLAYEASRTYRDEELLIGFGCTSQTTSLPKYKVDAHAATAFALAQDTDDGEWAGRIVLHRLAENGLSEGTEIIRADSVKVFDDPADLNGWKVIITKGAIERMRALKDEKAPNETGGYLYGGIDEAASEIYIVAVSPEPTGTKASPASLDLGPCGRTEFEKQLLRKTSGRLAPLGSWHSHPNGAPTASAKDWATVAKFKKDDKRYGQPTLIAITGATNERFYVAAD